MSELDDDEPQLLADIIREFLDPKVRKELRHLEMNYRRGFTHGYSRALDDLLALSRAGHDLRDAERILSAFFDRQLMDGWRNNHETLGDTPPSLPHAS